MSTESASPQIESSKNEPENDENNETIVIPERPLESQPSSDDEWFQNIASQRSEEEKLRSQALSKSLALQKQQLLSNTNVDYIFLRNEEKLKQFIRRIIALRDPATPENTYTDWTKRQLKESDFNVEKYKEYEQFKDLENKRSLIKFNKNHSTEVRFYIAKKLLDILHFEELPVRDDAYHKDPLFFLGKGVCSARLTCVLKSLIDADVKITVLLIRSTVIILAKLFGYCPDMILAMSKSESKRCRELIGVSWKSDLQMLRCLPKSGCGCTAHQVDDNRIPNPLEIFPFIPRGPFLIYAGFMWYGEIIHLSDLIKPIRKKYLKNHIQNIPEICHPEDYQSSILIRLTEQLFIHLKQNRFPKLVRVSKYANKATFDKLWEFCDKARIQRKYKIFSEAVSNEFSFSLPTDNLEYVKNVQACLNPPRRHVNDVAAKILGQREAAFESAPDVYTFENIGKRIATQWLKRSLSPQICNFFEMLVTSIVSNSGVTLCERSALGAALKKMDLLPSVQNGVAQIDGSKQMIFSATSHFFLDAFATTMEPHVFAEVLFEKWRETGLSFLEISVRENSRADQIIFYIMMTFNSNDMMHYMRIVEKKLSEFHHGLRFNVDAKICICVLQVLFIAKVPLEEIRRIIDRGLMMGIYILAKSLNYIENFFTLLL